MIFVTVGNATQRFRRLLDGIDRLAREGVIGSEEVLIQSGSDGEFRSDRCTVTPFLPLPEFARRLADARVVVSHAGAGTLIQVLRLGKMPVVMPRRLRYGELVDDHQVELARALEVEGRVISAFEVEDLRGAIEGAGRRGTRPSGLTQPRMLASVALAIEELLERRRGAAG